MKKTSSPAWRVAAMLALFLHAGISCACPTATYDPIRPLSVVQKKVDLLLHKRAFKELDRLAVQYERPDAVSADGQAMLLGFYKGLVPGACAAKGPDIEADAKLHRALVEQWRKSSSVPHVANIALASMESALAWRRRGGGFSNSVTPEGWSQFREHLKNAADMLDAMPAAARMNPHWYSARLDLALSQGWEPARFDALFKEAIGKFPHYTELYHTRGSYYSPKWHGSRAKFNAVVDEAEASPANTRGPKVLFVRMHLSEWSKNSAEQPDFDLMWQGFKNLVARYPDMYNHNRYAEWACKDNNATALDEQLAIIGDQMSMAIWGSEEYFKYCRQLNIEVKAGLAKNRADAIARRAAGEARRAAIRAARNASSSP